MGFPHFLSLGTAAGTFSPSLFDGAITKTDAGMFYTDCSVQAGIVVAVSLEIGLQQNRLCLGQSGGPIFDEHGALLGVCVCNAKDDNGLIFPNVNMCIPIWDIYGILEEYSRTKGNCGDKWSNEILD